MERGIFFSPGVGDTLERHIPFPARRAKNKIYERISGLAGAADIS